MRYIYIIVTCTGTWISKFIRMTTGEKYTHAAIAFDDDPGTMYSFARKYPFLPLPAGFMEEHTEGKFYRIQGDIPCMVIRKKVTVKQFYRLKGMIHGIRCRCDEYKYSLIGLLLCRMGIAADRPYRFFCSQFAAWLLEKSEISSLPKPSSLMHPVDLTFLDGFETVYEGGLLGWNELISRRISIAEPA